MLIFWFLQVDSRLTDVASALAVVDDLVVLTAEETSLFPQDINDTIAVLTSVIDFLSLTLEQTGMANANEVSTLYFIGRREDMWQSRVETNIIPSCISIASLRLKRDISERSNYRCVYTAHLSHALNGSSNMSRF